MAATVTVKSMTLPLNFVAIAFYSVVPLVLAQVYQAVKTESWSAILNQSLFLIISYWLAKVVAV